MYHGLSWETLASTTDPEKWNVVVNGRVLEKVKKWVREKAAAKDIPHILRAQQMQDLRLWGTAPLPPHYTMETGLSKVAFHFRSNRVRFLDSKKPKDIKCCWCRKYGQENGRHFLKCQLLPPALEGALKRLKKKCTTADIPEAKLMDFLILDWSPDPAPALLIKSVLVFQRSVLRNYRYAFFSEEPNGPMGFPVI